MIMREYADMLRSAVLACRPDLLPGIEASEQEHGEFLAYVWIGRAIDADIAAHVAGDDDPLLRLLAMTGTLLGSPHQMVREFASVGIIECMQGCLDQSEIARHASPRVRQAWQDVKDFWQGKVCPIPDRFPNWGNLRTGI